MRNGTSGPLDDDWPGPPPRVTVLCRYPATRCGNLVSHMHPETKMCQLHLLYVYGLIHEDVEAENERTRLRIASHEAFLEKRAEKAWRRYEERQVANPGTIYYLRIGSEYKIGWTKNLYNRLRQYPPTAELLATEPGSREDERSLHLRFAPYRVAGREWYRKASAISRHIKAVAEVHGAHDPRDPIRLNPRTPQEKQADSMRWIGKGNGQASSW